MKLIPILALALWLAGCSLYPQRPPQPALHDFGPAPASQAGTPPAITVEAPAWLHEERLRYRLRYADPTGVRFYRLDAWLAPPPTLLEQYLGNALAGLQPGWRLHLDLTEFEQVFDSPSEARVVLGFQASADNGRGTLSERRFHLSQPCPSPDAAGAVTAHAAVAASAADALRAWLLEAARAF